MISSAQKTVKIGSHEISPSSTPYVVAEISANHDGKLDQALAIVEAAAEAGANAVKIQTLSPSKITLNSPRLQVLGCAVIRSIVAPDL